MATEKIGVTPGAIPVTVTEENEIRDAARANGVPVGTYIRRALIGALNVKCSPVPSEVWSMLPDTEVRRRISFRWGSLRGEVDKVRGTAPARLWVKWAVMQKMQQEKELLTQDNLHG